MDDGTTAWLDDLARRLPAHAAVLGGLIAAAELDPRIRFLELCCSIARGAGDGWSDLDLGLGVADDAWPAAIDDLGPLLEALGDAVACTDHRIAAWGDAQHRRFVVVYRSGVQVDLVAMPAGDRPGLPDGSLALYDPDGRLATRFVSRLAAATAADVEEWTALAWLALLDLDKYVRRDSPWEALERLTEARAHVWRLWAVVQGLDYPSFGLTRLLDADPPALPTGMAGTVPEVGLDPAALRGAGLALAASLVDASEAASQATAPAESARSARTATALAEFVLDRLAVDA